MAEAKQTGVDASAASNSPQDNEHAEGKQPEAKLYQSFLHDASVKPSGGGRAGIGRVPGPFNSFCFHDVDLIPDKELLESYTIMPVNSIIHPASAWPRYMVRVSKGLIETSSWASVLQTIQGYTNYLGGIITLNEDHFRLLNGYTASLNVV